MKKIAQILIGLLLSASALADASIPPITTPNNTDFVKTRVLMKTSAGDLVLELDTQAAPETTKNFLQYVDEGFYNNTLFHRVIANFMVQGGGFDTDMQEKPTHPPIKNESLNGLRNVHGTIAMARTQNPDSATAQFFINVVDNAYLDGSSNKPGYAVFGTVTQGMDIIEKIAATVTGTRNGQRDVPVNDVVLISVRRLADAVAAPTADTKPAATDIITKIQQPDVSTPSSK
jgi:cyclophilin family peptidyl-prolyl cis-trans isomerase